jgi:hypothetical protein
MCRRGCSTRWRTGRTPPATIHKNIFNENFSWPFVWS